MSHTRAVTQSLTNGTFNAHANTIDNFLYDVYSVDFGGEGGAFHASKLLAQAKFIARSLDIIAEGCGRNIEDITIVAHSTGGLAARMAVVLLNKDSVRGFYAKPKLAQNVITLASPHVRMPFTLDSSITNFYDALKREENELYDINNRYTANIISISGGLRDEIIPPGSCWTGDMKRGDEDAGITISVLASDVMSPKAIGNNGALMYGMDHRAIVWCHNIVSVVRDLIHVMNASSKSTTSEARDQIQNYILEKMEDKVMACPNDNLNAVGCETTAHDYKHRIQMQEQILQDEYGFWGSQAMLTTMFYNARKLIILYVLNSIIHNIVVLTNSKGSYYAETIKCYFISPLVSTAIALIFYWSTATFHQINTINMLAIAFLAMNVYYTILYGLLPIFSFLVNSFTKCCSSRSEQSKDSKIPTDVKRGPQILCLSFFLNEIGWLLFTAAMHAVSSRIIASLMDVKDWTMNKTSILSHIFLIMVSFICLKICYLGYCPTNQVSTSSGVKQTYYLKQRRMIAALTVIIFPLIVNGKVIYAFSLLTASGQSKAGPFIEFERMRWVSHFGTSSTFLEMMWKHDLARFSISACLPVYLLLLYVIHRFK